MNTIEVIEDEEGIGAAHGLIDTLETKEGVFIKAVV